MNCFVAFEHFYAHTANEHPGNNKFYKYYNTSIEHIKHICKLVKIINKNKFFLVFMGI